MDTTAESDNPISAARASWSLIKEIDPEQSTKGRILSTRSDTGYKYPGMETSDITHMAQTCPYFDEVSLAI